MDNENYFKDIFKSIRDYKKIVLLKFLIRNDKNLSIEKGFSKNDVNVLNLEFKIIIIEQHEEYLSCIKNEEESIIEKILKK